MFNADSLRAVLVQAAPLMLVGLAASLAFRIGFWNLGLEGQMLFGGIFATGVSVYEIGPPQTRLLLMGVAAAVGGTLWCLLAGVLKIRFRVNEIIATLLLNYVAVYFLLPFALRRLAGRAVGVSAVDAVSPVRTALRTSASASIAA